MNAGRELDALVEEKVMGFVWNEARCRVCGWPITDLEVAGRAYCTKDSCALRPRPEHRADDPAPYSTDIAAAWEVVERFQVKPLSTGEHYAQRANFWLCMQEGTNNPIYAWDAKRAAHIICLASLKAVGVEL